MKENSLDNFGAVKGQNKRVPLYTSAERVNRPCLHVHTVSLDLVLQAEVTADTRFLGSLSPQPPEAENLWIQRGNTLIPLLWQFTD